jgi:hypothetical protein
MKIEICQLFMEVGKHYRNRGVADLFELHPNQDVHAFYRLSHNKSKVIHVQGYPGMSDENGAMVWARMMDYKKMMKIRKLGTVFTGNEHGATIQSFPNFQRGIIIPYDANVLEEKLEENVPELRDNKSIYSKIF